VSDNAAAAAFVKQFAISGPKHPGRPALDRLLRLMAARRALMAGQRVEVNTTLAAAGRECPAGIAGPRRRACGGA
jgi:hypothetical protein